MKKPENAAPAFDRGLVDGIRAASRQMVRELGFMQATLAATEHPPSAVHAILEIGARRSMTAAQLAEHLCLEKSSVSRMTRRLIDAGDVQEETSDEDARAKRLSLTAQGRRTLAAIHAYGRKQVTAALAHLTPAEQQAVGQGLAAYAAALQAHRLGRPVAGARAIDIACGYRPGAIGRIVDMHARFYSRHAGFGQFFESQVATGLAEFAARLAGPRNGLWLALDGQRIVGSVAIDGQDLGQGRAHLRWFIVDDDLRGAGAGRRLLSQAVAFCDDRGFASTHLWTFQGLDAARRLYEDFGFRLAEERPGTQWGETVTEQRFVRPRA